MNIYRINEAEFCIPETWQDRSANIFAVGNKLPLALSFVITRDELNNDISLEEYAESKIHEMERQLNRFEILEKRQIEIVQSIALDAQFRWRSEFGTMHQRQTYVQHGRRVLIFTTTAPTSLSEEQNAQVDTILSSLRLIDY